jgi:twitching motility protein PilT
VPGESAPLPQAVRLLPQAVCFRAAFSENSAFQAPAMPRTDLNDILRDNAAGDVAGNGAASDEDAAPGSDGASDDDWGRSQPEARVAAAGPEGPALPEIGETILEGIPETAERQDRVRYLADQVESLLEEDQAELRRTMEQYIEHMLEIGASDIDMGGPGAAGKVWYRIDGDKRPDEAMGTDHDLDETDLLFLSLLDREQVDILFEEGSVDFSHQLPLKGQDGRRRRFRVTCYFDYDRLALNMRAIEDTTRPLGSLGFHRAIEQGLMFRHVRDGLTLVTGVTGSGKSTTMDAIVDANNHDVPAHAVIIAKPVEYMHRSDQCIIRHREVGKDCRTFKEGITQALRQDPDIVVVGEMRDPETISAALEITDSGHKVFSTLHTSSAMETIDRVVAEYPPNEQERVRVRLADVLRCVISQKLLPGLDGGRVLAKEVLWMTSSARAAIKNENVNEIYQMMWEGGNLGQTTLEQDLNRLVRRREVSPEDALDFANNKKRLKRLLR